MAYLTNRKYSFVSNALDPDTFAVVDFSGKEGLSQTYRFEIMLVTENAEIDLGSVVQNTAKFTIHRDEEDDVTFHGILANFEQLHEIDEFVFYRVTLVPKLWWLNLTHHNQVFLEKTVQEIVETVLKDGGLTALDFEFRLQGPYQKNDFVCQYGETHFNFMSRWLEREGIYYYFEQSESGEKVIFTDTAISHTDSPNGGSLHYSPPSGLAGEHRKEIIQGFICRYNSLPRQIRLKDYNYRKPSLEMTGSAMVDEKGRGEVYYYGEHFRTPEEGNRLAKIRAQELLCGKEEFIGDSTVPYIQPGYTFTLQDHYRGAFNQKYLTVQMTHEGGQTGYLIAGIMKGLSDREERVFYQNHFTGIPAGTQFRPERTAEIPKITGTLNAKIDAAGSGKYAELDDDGRYKVILPFDLSGRKEGKASTWLRMVQPYAGSNHGMHFPLHKDTEVLLTFIEGNPDRPIIAGAAPNPETPSQVTGADQTMAKITTSGGNKIHMEDQEGKQRILLYTPTKDTFLRLGSHNDPGDDEPGSGEWGTVWKSEGPIRIVGGGKNELIIGLETSMIGGSHNKVITGINKLDIFLGFFDLNFAGSALRLNYFKAKLNYGTVKTNLTEAKNELSETINTLATETNKLATQTTELASDTNKLAATTTILAGETTKMANDVNNLNGNVTSLVGAVTEVKNETTVIKGTETEVAIDRTALTSNSTMLSGVKTTLASEHTLLTADNNSLSETSNTIAGLVNIV